MRVNCGEHEKEIKEMIVQQESKVKFKRNTEFTKRLRDENIRISEEKGRGELEDDDEESIKITASEI